MAEYAWPASLSGYRVHLVGIKGTGMAALAEILVRRGAAVSGSDVPEKFYTDALLARLGVPYRESFAAENVEEGVRLVVHSPAYSREQHVELRAALARGLPVISYPEALGLLSASADSSGVAGTHGKTTTTALAGTLAQALGLPVTVLVGSEVAGFGGRSTLVLGERYLVAETCEYRRHFLNFRPRRLVVTSVEADHLDYFRDLEDVLDAFASYVGLLPQGGTLIYAADQAGARAVAERSGARRPDLRCVPYGERAEGAFRLLGVESARGRTRFRLQGLEGEFSLPLPGRHMAWNAAAALALAVELLAAEGRAMGRAELDSAREALAGFRGTRRRSELVGEAGGVLFLDDYGHHPTEIRTTLEGYKSFYAGRRLVVDFMPHTYSRTRALLPQFAECFAPADLVVLHKVYASARESEVEVGGGGLRPPKGGAPPPRVDGRTLLREVSIRHPAVLYYEEPLEAVDALAGKLRPGDLFVTMGAGDNWKLGRALLARLGGQP
jgi:UDP-N-acetylmuramate--alanine ligase